MLEDETKKINLKSLSKVKKKRIKYDRKKLKDEIIIKKSNHKS